MKPWTLTLAVLVLALLAVLPAEAVELLVTNLYGGFPVWQKDGLIFDFGEVAPFPGLDYADLGVGGTSTLPRPGKPGDFGDGVTVALHFALAAFPQTGPESIWPGLNSGGTYQTPFTMIGESPGYTYTGQGTLSVFLEFDAVGFPGDDTRFWWSLAFTETSVGVHASVTADEHHGPIAFSWHRGSRALSSRTDPSRDRYSHAGRRAGCGAGGFEMIAAAVYARKSTDQNAPDEEK